MKPAPPPDDGVAVHDEVVDAVGALQAVMFGGVRIPRRLGARDSRSDLQRPRDRGVVCRYTGRRHFLIARRIGSSAPMIQEPASMPDNDLSGSRLETFDVAGWRGRVERRWRHLADADPLEWLTQQSPQTVQQRPSATTYRADTDGGTVYAKHMTERKDRAPEAPDWPSRLRWRLQPSLALRVLRMNRQFARHGLLVAPVLLAARRCSGWRCEELLVTGEIGHSDGEVLELKIRAVDAGGVVWLDKAFAGAVTDGQYDAIAADLRFAAAQLDDKRLESIRDFSMLRYANRLAPTVFGDYLETQEDGSVKLIRMPARSDPNLDRIRRMRETEYVISDTVDAKFQELHTDIASIYELWRKYRRKNLEYQASNAEHAQATKSAAPKGSFEDLMNQYDNYKWDRVTAQEQDRLAVAFSNEVGPKVEAIETRIAELTAWVDQRYALWHRLMAELFDVETTLQEADVIEKELIERIETLPRGEIE